jgi:hypothetical protein
VENSEKSFVRVSFARRVFILALSSVLAVLLFWLFGFIVQDIGQMPGPDREAIFGRHVDPALEDQLETTRREQEAIERQIEAEREDQHILETSLQNSRQTMDQLMGLHRLSLEQDVTPSQAEQAALAESETLFLDNQTRFQEANERVAALARQQRGLSETIRSLQGEIETQREPARMELHAAEQAHEFRVAALKLTVLIPLILIAGLLVLRWRSSAYAPALWAALTAILWRMTLVMWQHFPRDFFKYIAISASIVIVLALLVGVIRTVTSPRPQWLRRQRRESYRRGRCPVCAFPIAPSVLAQMGLAVLGKMTAAPSGPSTSKSHSCPACGTRLFEACAACGEMRHSLLPHCSKCGAGSERVA